MKYTDEDRKRLEKLLTEISNKSQFKQSLDQLITRWAYFVKQVERGFDSSIYEYTNDLSVRDVLEEIKDSLTETGQNQLASQLAPEDTRFKSATSPIQHPVRSGVTHHHWWWYRIPKILSGDLQEDIESEKYV